MEGIRSNTLHLPSTFHHNSSALKGRGRRHRLIATRARERDGSCSPAHGQKPAAASRVRYRGKDKGREQSPAAWGCSRAPAAPCRSAALGAAQPFPEHFCSFQPPVTGVFFQTTDASISHGAAESLFRELPHPSHTSLTPQHPFCCFPRPALRAAFAHHRAAGGASWIISPLPPAV